MGFWIYTKQCHWCGAEFRTNNPKRRHCSPKHKQAHFRAYKKYVTATGRPISSGRNAHKKRKKK